MLRNIDAVLDAVAEHGNLTYTELSGWTGIPRSAIYRIVESMTATGFLVRQPDGSVGLGTRMLRFGARAQRSIPEVRAAAPALDLLRDETGVTSYLCLRRNGATICLDWRQGGAIGLPILRPGMTLPSHAGAASLALLGAFPDEVDAVLQAAPFPQLSANTATTADELLRRVARVGREGYGSSDEDVSRGVAAFGVAFSVRHGESRVALSVSGVRRSVVPHRARIIDALGRAGEMVRSVLP